MVVTHQPMEMLRTKVWKGSE